MSLFYVAVTLGEPPYVKKFANLCVLSASDGIWMKSLEDGLTGSIIKAGLHETVITKSVAERRERLF